ncbi:MAG: pyruvate kinase [Bacteroidia bacterium]|nr:pyruvate kinase [Bacteroidia bacterium]MCZ2249017.1 pyruvate kinase [Bacteroidia bacterium]
MEHWTKTKIVATLGPASESRTTLSAMIDAGMDVARINSSHGNYDTHQKIIDTIRELNHAKRSNIAILVDLQGPKLRIGEVENNGVKLVEGQEIEITTKECIGTASKIYITYPQFPKDVAIGDRVKIDDGKLELEVKKTNNKDLVKAVVVNGGILSSKKGVNLPNTKISLPSLTPKDIEDLNFALKNNIEWVGLSFVRSVTDVIDLKERIKAAKKNTRVIAKIEKPEAIKEIDNIIDMADGIMVARGDLGVELPMEQVPLIQKMIVEKCIKASKPVIIATQMMESMINNYTPTRAEVNDVANAVLDGADAVMLSGETSVGKYPVMVIQHINRIIAAVEKEGNIYYKEHPPQIKNQTFISDSICFSACVMAQHSGAKGIVSMTNSGYTAFKLSSHRPKANIFIFTDNPSLLCTLNLVWGVRGFYYDKYESTDKTIADSKSYLKRHRLVPENELIIHIASIPMHERGRANMVKLGTV